MTLTPSRGNARSDSEPRLTEAGFFFLCQCGTLYGGGRTILFAQRLTPYTFFGDGLRTLRAGVP